MAWPLYIKFTAAALPTICATALKITTDNILQCK